MVSSYMKLVTWHRRTFIKFVTLAFFIPILIMAQKTQQAQLLLAQETLTHFFLLSFLSKTDYQHISLLI